MKTLTQIEPRIPVDTSSRVINAPGSYYLVEDIEVTDSLDAGIQITASDVTLDLNGMTVRTTIPRLGEKNAIDISHHDRLKNVTVRNGNISGLWVTAIFVEGVSNLNLWNLNIEGPPKGLYLQSSASGSRCEGVRIQDCSFLGQPTSAADPPFQDSGSEDGLKFFDACNIQIQGCSISGYAGDGVDLMMINTVVRPVGLITDCRIYNVGGNGLSSFLGSGARAEGLVVRGVTISLARNSGMVLYSKAVVESAAISNCGLYGIRALAPIVVGSSQFTRNGSRDGADGGGIRISNGQITGCTAYANSGFGFHIEQGQIGDCTAGWNTDSGFSLGTACAIHGSTAAHNGQPTDENGNISNSAADGINGIDGVLVRNCNAYQNADNGIIVGTQSVVTGSLAYNNGGHGINSPTTASVRTNHAYANSNGDYAATGGEIAPRQAGSTATHPGYNTY